MQHFVLSVAEKIVGFNDKRISWYISQFTFNSENLFDFNEGSSRVFKDPSDLRPVSRRVAVGGARALHNGKGNNAYEISGTVSVSILVEIHFVDNVDLC